MLAIMGVKDHPISRPHQSPGSSTPRSHATGYKSPNMSSPSNTRTPTKDTFGGVTGQRPLPGPSPASTFPDNDLQQDGSYVRRSDSIHSTAQSDAQDIDMEDAEGLDESDNESVAADGINISRKKKSQRFFCTDFPPCQLSFTRSEHLARHIRKHTGERPFQCHCLRRFSRLDNLRQHAQTVHLNEDIPCDSLAATSTRFQRQIRTDRIRPPNHRARASTISNTSSHGRGHSRNWSGSSIGSVSDIASPDEARRRPPPLAMAQSSPTRGGLVLDTSAGSGPGPDIYHGQYNDSPSGYSTPNSVISASPIGPSGIHSPVNATPRGVAWGDRSGGTNARRLSFPTGQNPHPPSYGAPMVQFMTPVASSAASTYSQSSSGFASPVTPVFSDVRRDPILEDLDLRRRTWHPGTYGGYGNRPATSGLSYHQTPDAPQPVAASQPAAAQAIRLPGIDSFDSVRAQPIAPPRRPPSVMAADPNAQAATYQDTRMRPPPVHADRTSQRDSWGSMNSGFTRLDIARAPQESSLGQAIAGNQPQRIMNPSSRSPNVGSYSHNKSAPAQLSVRFSQPSSEESEDPSNARRKKRQAWYNGPVPDHPALHPSPNPARTLPAGSGSSEAVPTSSSNYITNYQSGTVHTPGYREDSPVGAAGPDSRKAIATPRAGYPTAPPPQTIRPPPAPGMNRLDALVAVATSEKQVPGQR